MTQTITLIVQRVVETLEGRSVTAVRKGEDRWLRSLDLDVPPEQPVSPGDEITITVEWPA